MGRLLKILLITLFTIIVLLAIAVFVITQVIDPNEFKPEIEKQAQEQANLTLDIQGDLAWQFWPSLGVSLGRTEARIADEEALFAALDEASVSVAVLPLLYGQVEMDGITLAGLDVNLVDGPDGANWEQIGPQTPAEDTAKAEEPANAEEDSSSFDIPLTIPTVVVSDGKVRYRNTADSTDIVVEHFNLNAQDVNLDEPFPLQLSLRYQDQSDMRVDMNLDTVLSADLDNNHFLLNPMKLDANIAGATTMPVDVHLEQNFEVNLDEDTASIKDLLLQAAGTETKGNVEITALTGDMQLSGKLATAPFDANKVLEAIGEAPIETTDSQALSNIALEATLGGEPGSVMASPLTVTLDDSTLRGSAGLASLESGKIVFDLTLDKITLDGYMPPASGETETAAPGGGKTGGTNSLSDAELIPVDTLRPLRVDGKLAIGSLNYDGISASDMKFAVTANNGVLKLTQATGNTLGGSFSANGTLNVAGSTPKISATNKISSVQIQPIAQMALDDDLAKGIFSMSGSYSASGNSEKALMNSAKGNIDLSLADATVRGLNLYDTLVGGVNDMLGQFQGLAAALIPNQESGKLPSALSEDTKILDLKTKARLDKNVAYLDSLNATLSKGELSGNGWMNILNQDFDLKIGMQSPELGTSKYLQGTTWPLRCEGNLGGSPAKWCGPDKDGFKDIGKQVAANATKDKLKDKFGIEGEGDTTEEILKDAAQKKAKDEINKQLQDGLKKLFN
ncbi:cell envelope biogenesis protein AsmA [Alcanivorax sp. 97CO-5]|uniref:AsmA family protein n=1 Tax=unclassified Alcanivorax TaxID=2638842 RepID=UPI0003E7EF58|nr:MULTISPECIES: AsmA family protein [unclassified Alcanivorax]EUC67912.1 cell envelope biogenesis protein AsmA [Alcanivorax sp. 97CO-5]PKG00342.1 AsmA family protein [Alcanivorax sp. 97CO-6]